MLFSHLLPHSFQLNVQLLLLLKVCTVMQLHIYTVICIEPMMKHLHQIVVPKVAAEWRVVAEFLEFKQATINTIEEKCRSDPVKCCTEVFREWINSDHGVGPKTWSTLIGVLRQITPLTAVTKEIEQNLKCKFYHTQSLTTHQYHYCSY